MNKRWNQKSYAHVTVAKLQVEMAQEIFEVKASTDDKFYKEWKNDRSRFVNLVAPSLRDAARAALAELLGRHDVNEREKEEIYEALLMDRCIPNEDRWYTA
jgi:hypothetical protein